MDAVAEPDLDVALLELLLTDLDLDVDALVLAELEQVTRVWDGPIHLADTGAGIYNGTFPKAAYMCADLEEYEALYRGYMTMGLEHPQLIGLGWCGYYETPSSRSGLVDSRDDEPLAERVEILQRWNRWQDDQLAAAEPA